MSFLAMPPWRLSSSTLALCCMYISVVGLPTMNITVTVPIGSSNHGSPNLVCTPATWLDFISFFGANFFAHAATVRTLPGEKTREVALTIALALFFPFSGISRGIEAIVRHASWPPADPLRVACRAGALCILLRDAQWRPKTGMKFSWETECHLKDETKSYKKENNRENTIQDSTDSPQQPPQGLSIPLDTQPGIYKFGVQGVTRHSRQPRLQNGPVISEYCVTGETFNVLHETRNIHGQPGRLDGYIVGILPSNALVKRGSISSLDSVQDDGSNSIQGNEAYTPELVVSSSQGIPTAVIAIIQVFYAAFTIYHSRGDQLNHYGYAAFGLTVLPYLIMSVVNFTGNILTPTYSSLYLVDSLELRECCPDPTNTSISPIGRIIQDDVGKTAVGEVVEVVSVGDPTTSYLTTSYSVQLRIHSSSLSGDISLQKEMEATEDSSSRNASPPRDCNFTVTRTFQDDNPDILVPPYINFLKRKESERWSIESIPYHLIPAVVIIGIIPYAVIGALTHFQSGESSVLQRVFTMYWLTAGLVVGAAMPFVKLNTTVIIWLWGLSTHNGFYFYYAVPLLSFIFLLLFSSAAIGGMVVVGQMLKEYGTCTAF